MSKQDANGSATSSSDAHHRGLASGLMLRVRWLFAGFAFGFVAALTAGFGRGDRGPAEEIGQAFDKATRTASSWIGSTVETGRLGGDVASQVDDRLDSDKGLDSSKIEVRAGTDGAVELHGMVASPDAKERAVALARDTRGIKQVVDHLAVVPKARVVSSPDEPDSADPGRSPTTPPESTPRVIRAARSPNRSNKVVE